jgi:hypothetical protein
MRATSILFGTGFRQLLEQVAQACEKNTETHHTGALLWMV